MNLKELKAGKKSRQGASIKAGMAAPIMPETEEQKEEVSVMEVAMPTTAAVEVMPIVAAKKLKKRGRKPLGDRAMTDTERKRRYRQKLKEKKS